MGFLLPVKGRSARNVSQTSMALKFLLDIGGLLQMGMTALWLEVLGGRRFRQRRQARFLDRRGGKVGKAGAHRDYSEGSAGG